MKCKCIYIVYIGGIIGMKKLSWGYVLVEGFLIEIVVNNVEFNCDEMFLFDIYEYCLLIDFLDMLFVYW